MIQKYEKYTSEDQEVWSLLFSRQRENLADKTDQTYQTSIAELASALNKTSIPKFYEMDSCLDKNGWRLEVVPGLIPIEDFFSLLAERKFCSSTWLRSKAQLDYLEEPDMFHDIFGHTPLIMDPVYARFMEEFGKIGRNYLTDTTVLTALQRLYWFTIEFGLIKGKEKSLIYGAGIISSFGESNHIYSDPIEIIPFEIEKVINTPFINSEIQNLYYEIEDYNQLFESIKTLKEMIENGLDITPAIVR